MNLDFHVHGILSKKLDFNGELFMQAVESAKSSGLNGFILSEHFNAKDVDKTFEFLEKNFKYEHDRYEKEEFCIYPGMEVDLKGNGQIIVFGPRENIWSVNESLRPHRSRKTLVTINELLDIADENKCLKIGAHPFREGEVLYDYPAEVLKRLDAFDLNGRDIYNRGLETVEDEVRKLSAELKTAYVTGSDSHYPTMLGCVKTHFEYDFKSIEELKEAIHSEKFTRIIEKDLPIKVATAKIAKRHIKKKIKEEKEKIKKNKKDLKNKKI